MPRTRGSSGWGISGGAELRAISRELRRMGDGRTIRLKLTREIRLAVAPLLPGVRQSALSIPAKGEYGSTGLRRQLARATTLRVRTAGRSAGVSIGTRGNKMPSGEYSLPEMEEGLKPWRHPVFARPGTGRSEQTWVTQESHPYFFPALRSAGPRARIAIARVISEINHEITLGK